MHFCRLYKIALLLLNILNGQSPVLFFWICCTLSFFYGSSFCTNELSMFGQILGKSFMELVVVNMDIILLTSGLRLSKSTFFHMKTSWRGGLYRHWSKHFYLYPFLNKDWVFEFCKMQVWVLKCCKFSNGFMVEPWWEFRR